MSAASLTIAVLGAGVVGRTLASGWAGVGHAVVLGSRRPDAPAVGDALDRIGHGATAATHADAVAAADVVVITVPGDQVVSLIETIGASLPGKVTIDTTNDLTPGATPHHLDALTATGARVFRACNSTGWEQMAQPVFGAIRSDMPYAGPDTPERSTVHGVIEDLGFRAVWLGDTPEAHALTDDLARLWFHLAFQRGWGRRLGLRLLSADDDEPDQR